MYPISAIAQKKARQCGEKKKYPKGNFFFGDIFLNVVFGRRLKANHEVVFFFFLIPSSEEQSGFRSEPAHSTKQFTNVGNDSPKGTVHQPGGHHPVHSSAPTTLRYYKMRVIMIVYFRPDICEVFPLYGWRFVGRTEYQHTTCCTMHYSVVKTLLVISASVRILAVNSTQPLPFQLCKPIGN